MSHVSKCEHNIYAGLCRKCYPLVITPEDWGVNVEMKQEPVAWLYERIIKEPDCHRHIKGITRNAHDLKQNDKIEPLYTSPQYRELSIKEIDEIEESSYVQSGIDEYEFDLYGFVDAILKKASEK